ncbi:hypothetical protein ABZ341_23645 [Streptomyces sp. NPDC006173]|uniref:hypothetical protein n=1 Tax=Streptomyces sp. NPDC006173 TaxID=3155349 RepID=UPI0033FE7DE3
MRPSTGARPWPSAVTGVRAVSLAARPVLCDLLGAQAPVLERNVSPAVAAECEYEHAAIAGVGVLARLVRTHVPELGDRDAGPSAAAIVKVAGTAWPHSRPPSRCSAPRGRSPTGPLLPRLHRGPARDARGRRRGPARPRGTRRRRLRARRPTGLPRPERAGRGPADRTPSVLVRLPAVSVHFIDTSHLGS